MRIMLTQPAQAGAELGKKDVCFLYSSTPTIAQDIPGSVKAWLEPI
jgi:hypothetical protein